MKAAFLEVYPDSRCSHETLHQLGCFWGTLSCIESFLLSEHPYCYFVQDDFVPVVSSFTETPIVDLVLNVAKLSGIDPNFRLLVYTYHFNQHRNSRPDKSAQIREDVPIYQGLFDYGDQGLVLDKKGADYFVKEMKKTGEYLSDVIKGLIGTRDGDAFYILNKENYKKYFMLVEWSEMYP